VEIVVGVALALLGAAAATVTVRQLEDRGQGRVAPLALVPFGILIGAGAAIARGWDLVPTAIAGAVLLPVVTVVARLVAARRSARR
jgi:hypothetical protein